MVTVTHKQTFADGIRTENYIWVDTDCSSSYSKMFQLNLKQAEELHTKLGEVIKQFKERS